MSELFNIRHRSAPSDAVNIMRPGKWGNPFEEKDYGREGCIALYEHMLFENPALVAMMRVELVGKDLVCCCWPKACHGNVILRILKGEEPQPLHEEHPLLLKVYGNRRDPLKDALKRYEQLSNNPAPEGDGGTTAGTTAGEYEALLDGLVPHLRRLVAGRQPSLPTPAQPEGATLEQYKEAFNLWHDKTEWVQKELNSGVIGAKAWGQHRADVILSLVTELRAEVEALKAEAARSDEQIVQQTLSLAGQFYQEDGYIAKEGHQYWKSSHPRERLVWRLACIAQIELTDTDPEDALSALPEHSFCEYCGGNDETPQGHCMDCTAESSEAK